MTLSSRKITSYVNPVANLPDNPSMSGMTAAQLKAAFDALANEELKTSINGIVDDLTAVTDGTSGADNIGATAIADLNGLTVQALLESLRNILRSILDGVSGADFIGTTAIDGLSGTTVQAVLESLKSYLDTYNTNHKKNTSTDHDNRYYTEAETDTKVANLQEQVTTNANGFANHKTTDSVAHPANKISLDPTGKTKITASELKTAIDQIENEIKQFIGANANVEVADARISTEKAKTFPTLRDRLEESEEQINTLDADITERGINVKGFLCDDGQYVIGDGIHDDTTGIKRAIDYVCSNNHSALFFPTGSYKITDTLHITTSIRIIGTKGKQYRNGSYIIYYGNDVAIKCYSLNTNSEYQEFWGVMIENISVLRSGWTNDGAYGTGGIGIQMIRASESQLINVTIEGFRIGLHLGNASICNYIGMWLANNRVNVWMAQKGEDGVSYGVTTTCNFYYCNLWNTLNHIVAGGENILFHGCHIEQSASHVLLLDGQYELSILNFAFVSCNIRTYVSNARFIHVKQYTGAIIINNLTVRDGFVKCASTTDYPIYFEWDDVGSTNRDAYITFDSVAVFGCKTALAFSTINIPKLTVNNRLLVKQNADGSGIDMPFSGGGVSIRGYESQNYYTLVHSPLKFTSKPIPIQTDGGFYYDSATKFFKYSDGVEIQTILKNSFGTTRPTNVLIGLQHFDTTLGKPIWYKGVGVWVDATGTVV